MRLVPRLLLIATLLLTASAATAPAYASGVPSPSTPTLPVPGPCQQGVLPSGALSLFCIPAQGWNGDLFVFAHGYTDPNAPLGFQNLTLPDGASLPVLAQSLGYAFATTSYRRNGLAILEGVDDIRQLVAAFPAVAHATPRHTYLVGASEGGIVTTLLVEQSPKLFSGGMATCGPIGNFKKQVDYWGDFRVLFDYFFPSVLPPTPVAIPPGVMTQWGALYAPTIATTVTQPVNANAARQLISTSHAAIDPAQPATVVNTTLDILWYNVFATNDAHGQLGGNPYGNQTRWYWGSDNDLRLNLNVYRVSADAEALAALGPYETTGKLRIPLVTMHTTGDDVVPFWHELYYIAKAQPTGRGSLTPIPIFRYGHCNFKSSELLAGFGILVLQAEGHQPPLLKQQFSLDQVQRDLKRAQKEIAIPAEKER
jgi:hypothetical protein